MATGDPSQNGQLTEIINLTNPRGEKKVWPTNQSFWGCFSGLLQGQPFVGGGFQNSTYSKKIHFLLPNDLTKNLEILEGRRGAYGISVNSNKFFISGGRNELYRGLNSTEFLKIEEKIVKSTHGPNLPFTIRWHTLERIDENSILMIGGLQNDSISNDTWILTFCGENNFEVKSGPKLKFARKEHCSGIMSKNGKKFIIVAGGIGEQFEERLNSVEILEISPNFSTWKIGTSFFVKNHFQNLSTFSGPKLPFAISNASMVTSPNQNGVIIIGGISENISNPLKSLFELHFDHEGKMAWTKLDQELNYPRAFHVSIPIKMK